MHVSRTLPARLLVIVMLLCSNLFLPSGSFEPDQPRYMSTANRAVRIETGGVADQQDNEHMMSNEASSLGIETHLSKYGVGLMASRTQKCQP